MPLNLVRGLACAGSFSMVVAIAACQGNIGGGSGLSIPQAPSYNQPAGPQSAAGPTRERVLDGAVYLGPKLNEVPLPQLGGFAIAIELGTPGPAPSPSLVGGSARPTGLTPAAAAIALRPAAVASPAPPTSPPASPSSAASSPALAGSAPASATASADGSAPPPTASRAPSPAPSAVPPKITTKTVIYPDNAPAPPTPIPTGEVQVFTKRTAIVRGYLQSETEISLYGLAAVHFTVPANELLPKRGFTIALYENGKHRHDRLIAYDTSPTVATSIVSSAQTDPLILKKGVGYLLLLYGDETPPTPAPAQVAPGYPSPGNNPFPMPSGSGAVYPTPYNPYATPTPYNPYAPPTPYNPYATPQPH